MAVRKIEEHFSPKLEGKMMIMEQTNIKNVVLGFITVPKDYDGREPHKVGNHPNLTAARNYLNENWGCTVGVPKNPNTGNQKQKMREYPQNKPGFNAEQFNSSKR